MTEQTPETVLYNADAPQSVPLSITQDGQVFRVEHKFRGIDDALALAVLDADEDNLIEAVTRCYDGLFSGLDGYDDLPAEIDKASIPYDEKLSAINEGLLLCAINYTDAPAGKKPRLISNPVSVYPLKAFFDGKFVDTKHWLAAYNAVNQRVWNAMVKKSFPVHFGDHVLKTMGQGLVALYDALVEKTEGYVGRVPAHHKMKVATQHFIGHSAALLKK
jgi:hypothetical protein